MRPSSSVERSPIACAEVTDVDIRPLRGRTVLVTRALEQAGELADRLRSHGAEVIVLPLIAIEPLATAAEVEQGALELLDHGGERYLAFTSANAVRLLSGALPPALRAALAGPSGCTICAVGERTAGVLREAAMPAHLVADDASAEGLAEILCRRPLSGARVWLPLAAGAGDVLPSRLRGAGAFVDVLQLYRTVLPTDAGEHLASSLRGVAIDAVTFTSASSARHFAQALAGRPFPAGAIAACIGYATAAAATAAGFPVAVVAQRPSALALADALAGYSWSRR
jgi:uroporphyrinogen III methyltransferase/synthase